MCSYLPCHNLLIFHFACLARVISLYCYFGILLELSPIFLIGENVFLQQHSGNCPFEVTWCENKCGAKLERRFIGNHTKNECHKRTVECKYCNMDFVAETLQVLIFIGNFQKIRL